MLASPARAHHSAVTDDLRDRLQSSLGTSHTIERELGGGGMSRVFVARELALGRDVVIKVLSPELAESLSAERFAREIRLASSLQEPHIVPVISVGVTGDGLPWFVMPFVRGESLRARIERGPLETATAVRILHDMAHALAYAHGEGVVHRDIKPDNVLLHEGTAVVTDFGIAKALTASRHEAPGGPLTGFGASLGTPAYMAPEQAAGDSVDARADVYAWGVTAYELLAGYHPFHTKKTAQQLIAAHIAEQPARFPAKGATGGVVEPELRDLVMCCLAKDPGDRPASGIELLAVLDGAELSKPRRRTAVRRPLAIAIAVAALLMASVVAVRFNLFSPRKAEAAAPIMLAVLPFDNAGPADLASFTDGLTDAVTAKLGGLATLAVIDRRSAAQYRQTTKPTRQIGVELGVQYLVEGVVRWASDSAGTRRGQVVPTLVDARTGLTKWTGDPVVVTPDDPFSVQGLIATRVAEALQIALRPGELAGLTRRFSDNPEAFAAYQRGRGLVDVAGRGSGTPYMTENAAREFERAVSLDSTFGEAWGWLAIMHRYLAEFATGDSAAAQRMRAVLARAQTRAPEQPWVLLTTARTRLDFDRDTTGIVDLVRRAITRAPNDALVLHAGSRLLAARYMYDSAYAVSKRAVALDPRSPEPLNGAAGLAKGLRRWTEARRYTDALIALDSTDERGWAQSIAAFGAQGDTAGARRMMDRAMAALPHPTAAILGYWPYVSDSYARRYLTLSARDLNIGPLYNRVSNYYDFVSDVYLKLGDLERSRIYSDSIVRALQGRSLAGPQEHALLVTLAFAQANLGQTAEARETLGKAVAVARRISSRPDLTDVLSVGALAGIHARLGEPDAAVRWIDASVRNPFGYYTARGYGNDPKLKVLRGNAAFERLIREER